MPKSKRKSSSKKKSLSDMIKSIAKRDKIPLKPRAAPALAPRVDAVGSAGIPILRPHVSITPPKARPCGSREKSKDRYTREELVKLARSSGIKANQTTDELCAELGISPRADIVRLPAKACSSLSRGDDRYTRQDVELLAKSRGIAVKGKDMNELCRALGIRADELRPDAPAAPRRGGSSSKDKKKSPRVSSKSVSDFLSAFPPSSKSKPSSSSQVDQFLRSFPAVSQGDDFDDTEIIPDEFKGRLTDTDKSNLRRISGYDLFPRRRSELSPSKIEEVMRYLRLMELDSQRAARPAVSSSSQPLVLRRPSISSSSSSSQPLALRPSSSSSSSSQTPRPSSSSSSSQLALPAPRLLARKPSQLALPAPEERLSLTDMYGRLRSSSPSSLLSSSSVLPRPQLPSLVPEPQVQPLAIRAGVPKRKAEEEEEVKYDDEEENENEMMRAPRLKVRRVNKNAQPSA